MGRPHCRDSRQRKIRREITQKIVGLVEADYPFMTISELQKKFNLSESAIKKIAKKLGMRKINIIRQVEVTHPNCDGVFLFFLEGLNKFGISYGSSSDIFSQFSPSYLFLMSYDKEDYDKYIKGLPNSIEKDKVIYNTDKRMRDRFKILLKIKD